MDDLKPCPFCGQPPNVMDADKEDILLFETVCSHCGASSDNYDTIEEAITAWNTRAKQDEIHEET